MIFLPYTQSNLYNLAPLCNCTCKDGKSIATVRRTTTVRERQIRGDRQGNFQLEGERDDILCRFKYFIGSFQM